MADESDLPTPSVPASEPGTAWVPPNLEELQSLLPQYEFLSMLGRGGMGAVYKAVQKSLDRVVAIKILPPGLGNQNALFKQRFKNEARTMARLMHPGIVAVFDFGETSAGQLYFVMEYVDGSDVAQMIHASGSVPPEYALAITAHVCDALAYAHDNGIIHRDIKPANVLINRQGQVKVADFGLAKQHETSSLSAGLTKTGMAVGTLDYVAPEMLTLGIEADGRADLYAVGVMLYQMLLGEVPRGLFLMPSVKTDGSIDSRFDEIITRAMQTDRARRYQSASDLRKDLDIIVTAPLVKGAEAPTAPAATQPAVREKPVPRRVTVPAREIPAMPVKKGRGGWGLGIAAMVLAAGAAYFLWPRSPEPQTLALKKDVVSAQEAPSPQPSEKKATPTPAKRETPTSTPPPVASSPAVESASSPAPVSVPSPMAHVPAPSTAARQMPTAPVSPDPAPPAGPLTLTQELAEIEQGFQRAYEQQVASVHRAAVADLNQKLLKALDDNIAVAAQSGNLEEALALRNEKAHVHAQASVPAESSPGTPAAVVSLRQKWHQAMVPLLSNRDKLAEPLHAAYDRTLASLQDRYTKAQKLDDAAHVRTVREQLAQRRDDGRGSTPKAASAPPKSLLTGSTSSKSTRVAVNVPVAPPLSADKILPPLPKATPEEIRELCEWALQQGGRVCVMERGRQDIRKIEDLPKGSVRLTEFELYNLAMDQTGLKWFSIIGRCPDLEVLLFNINRGFMPVELLRGANKLKILHLRPTEVDDAAFSHLSGLKNLEYLAVDYCVQNFTGEGLGYVHEGLQRLSIDSPKLTEKGLAYLSRFQKLRELRFNNSSASGRCQVNDAMLKSLAALPELTSLDLTRTPIDGSFLAQMPDNSKLTGLWLAATENFQPEHLIHLRKFRHLEFIALPPVAISPEVMNILSELPELKALEIYNPKFTGEEFKGAKSFRSLQSLVVDDSPITDAGLAAMAEAAPDVKDFRLSHKSTQGTTCTAAGFGVLASRMKGMTSLNLTDRGITDEWMPHVGKLKNIDYLVLVDANITDASLPYLKDLPVWYLRLSGTRITDNALPILKTFPKIGDVLTDRSKMTDAGRKELDKIIKEKRAAR